MILHDKPSIWTNEVEQTMASIGLHPLTLPTTVLSEAWKIVKQLIGDIARGVIKISLIVGNLESSYDLANYLYGFSQAKLRRACIPAHFDAMPVRVLEGKYIASPFSK